MKPHEADRKLRTYASNVLAACIVTSPAMLIVAVTWALSYLTVRVAAGWVQLVAPVVLAVWATVALAGLAGWTLARSVQHHRAAVTR